MHIIRIRFVNGLTAGLVMLEVVTGATADVAAHTQHWLNERARVTVGDHLHPPEYPPGPSPGIYSVSVMSGTAVATLSGATLAGVWGCPPD